MISVCAAGFSVVTDTVLSIVILAQNYDDSGVDERFISYVYVAVHKMCIHVYYVYVFMT